MIILDQFRDQGRAITLVERYAFGFVRFQTALETRWERDRFLKENLLPRLSCIFRFSERVRSGTDLDLASKTDVGGNQRRKIFGIS